MTKIRAVLKRRWPIVVVALVLGALAGAASSVIAPSRSQTLYRASEVVVANRATGGAAQGNVDQDALRVTRGAVADQAAEQLGEPDQVKELAAEMEAVPNLESSSIEVSTEDTDSVLATRRVDAFVQSFLDVINAELLKDQDARGVEIQRNLDQATAALQSFDAANPTIAQGAAEPGSEALVAQRKALNDTVIQAQQQVSDFRANAQSTKPYTSLGAEAPTVVDNNLLPVPSSPLFRMAVLALVGLVLGAGLVMVLERVSPRIDTRDELVDAVDVPILAEVGNVPRKRMPRTPDGRLEITGAWAEPNRRIRSAIQFLQANPRFSAAVDAEGRPRSPRVFMITSASPGEGKSTTVALIGLAMAEAGVVTLVVGGDFRRPAVDRLLGAPSEPGIRDLARLDLHRPTHAEVVHRTPVDKLWVAPSGPATKEVVGLADAARELISDASRQGGTVLVDSCPIEAANDAIDLLPVVDEVILVVRSGRTARSTLTTTMDQLRMHGAHVMGVVLIGTPGLGRIQTEFEDYYAPQTGGEVPTLGPAFGSSRPAAPQPSAAPPPAAPQPSAAPPPAGRGPAANGQATGAPGPPTFAPAPPRQN